MPWLYITLSFALGVVTGFATFSRGRVFRTATGLIIQGLLSIACFALMIIAFWKFGWKVGAIEVILIFVGANVGLSILNHLRKKFR